MKKLLLFLSLSAVFSFVSAQNSVGNYSGCCSWHNGVLGVCNGIVACNDGWMDSTCSTLPSSVYDQVNSITTRMNQITEEMGRMNNSINNGLSTHLRALYNDSIYRLNTEFQNLDIQRDGVIQAGLIVEYNSCVADYNIKLVEDARKKAEEESKKAEELEKWRQDTIKELELIKNDALCKLQYGDNFRTLDGICICEIGYSRDGTNCAKENTTSTQSQGVSATQDTKKSLQLKSIVTIILNDKLATKTSLINLFTNCSTNNKDYEIREACGIVADWLEV